MTTVTGTKSSEVDDRPIVGFCTFLAVAATLATGQLFGYLSFLPSLTAQFGSSAKLGLPLFALGYAIGMLAIGSLAGRYGARRVLVVSLILGGVLSGITAMSAHLAVLLALRLLEGLALGGFPPAAFVAAAQKVPPTKILFPNSAMVFGLLGSAGAAGLMARLMEEFIGWRAGTFVFGVLLVAAAGVASRLKGLAPGSNTDRHPYRHVVSEATVPDIAFAAVIGAITMGAFVTVNGVAQASEHSIAALVVVVGAVLLLLSFAKSIVVISAIKRRCFGLLVIAGGIAVLLWWQPMILVALGAVAVGATLVVPASIQIVIGQARALIPVAVATFTASLFVGGSLAGLAVTGLVHIEIQLLTCVLLFLVIIALIAAIVQVFRLRLLEEQQ